MASFVTISALFTVFMVTSPLLTSAAVVITEREPREYSTMDDSDIRELTKYCADGSNDGVFKMIDSFGMEQVGTVKSYNNWTCLFWSVDRSVDVVERLAQNIADLDTINGREEETALKRAIRFRAYLTIATLIRYGASLEKAKSGNARYVYYQNEYEKSMAEEKTKAAIAFGQKMNALELSR